MQLDNLIREAANPNLNLESALLIMKKNKERFETEEEYYEEDHVKPIITHYYKDIQFDNTDKKELFKQLNELVTNTHDKQLPYNSTTRNYLYSWVDLQIDGNLKSIYSGEKQDPEKVMREDYEVDLKRNKAYEALISDSDKQVAMSLNESDHMYNCEHVVPQSWFNKGNPMRGDLHHLFTCEKDCNSLRSNHPYYDFIDYSPKMAAQVIKTKCGKYEVNKFEPESGKGAVARATLYFLLRYPKEISQYRMEDIDLLLNWHTDNKVSIYEKHRNQAIFNLQKNRNPLIDLPEYFDKIDFGLGIR
jgi:deoxyribonuclease I